MGSIHSETAHDMVVSLGLASGNCELSVDKHRWAILESAAIPLQSPCHPQGPAESPALPNDRISLC